MNKENQLDSRISRGLPQLSESNGDSLGNQQNDNSKNRISRKKFFQLGGLLSASFLALSNIKLPFLSTGTDAKHKDGSLSKAGMPVIQPNSFAVKREKHS